ncbi:hypothetical protein ACOSQ4_021818 [Xanthoceras sorbifolium]
MLSLTCVLLEKMNDNGLNCNILGEVKFLGISFMLCEALQMKSQDKLNALNLVSTTKTLLQKLREDGWDTSLRDLCTIYGMHKTLWPVHKQYHS